MNLFTRIFNKEKHGNSIIEKSNSHFSLTSDEDFSIFNVDPFNDTYLCNAWVNIAVNILDPQCCPGGFCA